MVKNNNNNPSNTYSGKLTSLNCPIAWFTSDILGLFTKEDQVLSMFRFLLALQSISAVSMISAQFILRSRIQAASLF
jgi:hypothetical protein